MEIEEQVQYVNEEREKPEKISEYSGRVNLY